MRDDTLVHKLCNTLKNIFGDTLLKAEAENYILASFSPKLQVGERGDEDKDWFTNPGEAQVSFPGLHSRNSS